MDAELQISVSQKVNELWFGAELSYQGVCRGGNEVQNKRVSIVAFIFHYP